MQITPHRPTYGASVAPTGTDFAHIVEMSGYPHAVQRYLDGLTVTTSRVIDLPVEGPVVKVQHSDTGVWLACEVKPHGSEHTQVWVVTTDPEDPTAKRAEDGVDVEAHLVGWDGDTLLVSILAESGSSESRQIDPQTLEYRVVDRTFLGQMTDAHDDAILVRTGRRGQYRLRYRDNHTEQHLYPKEKDSVTDQGRFMRARGENGSRRMLVRSDHGGEYKRLDLVSVDAGEITRRPLVERDGLDLDEFALSLDDSTVALLWNVRGGRSELQIFDVATETLGPPIYLPEPVASGLSISEDGALVSATMQGAGQQYTVDVVDTRTRHWAPIDHIAPDKSAVQPDRLDFPSHDGLDISGWLYRPEGARGPGPLMLWFHGGPEDQFRPGWNYLFPTIVQSGVTVFAPNLRGSTGFGRSFSHADDLDKRWDGIADVKAIVDEMIGRGIADPGRICMAGRSYGGYLTWTALARYPELFACGIPVCGMSDLGTFYENTEPWIAEAAFTKYGHPAKDRELLAELSAMPIIDRIQAPVLAIHGAEDTNVPVSESTQAVRALKERGLDARLQIFEGEGHQFLKPENLLVQAGMMAGFLKAYLG